MCSNDYLGIWQHSDVIAAVRFLLEVSVADNIAGSNHAQVDHSGEITAANGKEAALRVNTSYMSNWVSLCILASRRSICMAVSSAANHASMIEGIRHSREQKCIWKHNDLANLEAYFRAMPLNKTIFMTVDSAQSMDGNIAAIEQICGPADEYGAIIYLVEYHEVGLYRPHGAGIAKLQGMISQITFIAGTSAKAFGVVWATRRDRPCFMISFVCL